MEGYLISNNKETKYKQNLPVGGKQHKHQNISETKARHRNTMIHT